MGAYAGQDNTGGYGNSFYGHSAGADTLGGDYNTFVGYNAGRYNTSGHSNTFLGYFAGYSNTTADYNTFVGRFAGRDNTADANTFVGYAAGYNNTIGEVAFASQKQNIALYVLRTNVLEPYRHRFTKSQIGKGCIRYRNPNRVDFDMIAKMLDKTVSDTGPVC